MVMPYPIKMNYLLLQFEGQGQPMRADDLDPMNLSRRVKITRTARQSTGIRGYSKIN